MASVKGHIQIDKSRCKGCGFCVEFCPKDCISLSDELNLKGYYVAASNGGDGSAEGAPGGDGPVDGGACNGCGTCALMCPEVAIEVVRE